MQTNVQIDSKNLRPSPEHKGHRTVEELVTSSPSERNWRGILIALLVIVAVLGLIVFSIFLLSPVDEASRLKGRRLTVEDVVNRGLKPRAFNGTWLSESELVYRDLYGGLSILNAENLTTRVLMTNSTFRQLNAERCLVSRDLQYVLLLSDENQDGAMYNVYEVSTRSHLPLSPREDRTAHRIQLATWAPRGSALAFVYQNDLYYKPKVHHDLVCRITNTGRVGLIYNAVPDWLYGSRGLKGWGSTLVFSPDGGNIAFITYNDTQVEEYKYMWFGDKPYPTVKSVRYPKVNTPNPEVSLQIVTLSRLKFLFPEKVKPPPGVQSEGYLGGLAWNTHLTATWINRAQNTAVTAICQRSSSPSYECVEVFTESTETGWVEPTDPPIFNKNMYHFIHANTTKADSTNEKIKANDTQKSNNSKATSDQSKIYNLEIMLLQRLPVRDGAHGSYRHLCLVAGGHVTPLTMGRFEVMKVIGWDEDNELVYFIATPEKKPGQRHLYKIHLHLKSSRNYHNDTNITRPVVNYSSPQCMTCDEGPHKQNIRHIENLATNDTSTNNRNNSTNNKTESINMEVPIQANDDFTYYMLNDFIEQNNSELKLQSSCLYNDIRFSYNFTFYVQKCLGPDAPTVFLVETATNTRIAVLDSGTILRERIANISAPQIRTFEVEIQDGYHAQVRLYLPPGMKEDEETTFPLILHVDGFPGDQLVTEKYSVNWGWYLCSGLGFLVAEIDGRGSGGQGEKMRAEVKSKLGAVDAEDQMAVLIYLRDNVRFIDPTKICVWGWGYGGYLAAMMLAQDSMGVLKCAASVNPPSSWSYHDTFFTERYMGLGVTGDNFRAFEEADLTKRAGNFDDRSLLLIHGTADEEVPPQHSMLLVRQLTNEGVIFRQSMYPDEGHKMKGVLLHLYRHIESFFADSFAPSDIPDWDAGPKNKTKVHQCFCEEQTLSEN